LPTAALGKLNIAGGSSTTESEKITLIVDDTRFLIDIGESMMGDAAECEKEFVLIYSSESNLLCMKYQFSYFFKVFCKKIHIYLLCANFLSYRNFSRIQFAILYHSSTSHTIPKHPPWSHVLIADRMASAERSRGIQCR
jgi:hypothetical protein